MLNDSLTKGQSGIFKFDPSTSPLAHPTMNIHQLSVTYSPTEDRLLLRINTTTQEEIQVWLTRRMTMNLMPHLPKVAAEQLALSAPVQTPLLTEQDKQVFADFKQHEHIRQADFSQPYQESEKKLLEQALVLTDLQMKPQADGMTLLVLQDRKTQGSEVRSLELRLKPHLIHGLLHLIQEVWPKTGWGDLASAPSNAHPALPSAPVPGSFLN
jgi:hypothetical protein